MSDRARVAVSMSEQAVDEALGSIRPSGVAIGCRSIAAGDEDFLFPSELNGIRSSVLKVRRSSGAARRVARELLRRHGLRCVEIPRSTTGAPVWPAGFVGSIAHDETFAIAAVADSRQFRGLGVDVEPAVPLPPELLDLIATPAECRCLPTTILQSRVLFAVKEAVYKAASPLDGVFLEFHDVEFDLQAATASTRTGWSVKVAFTWSPRVLAIALINA